HAAVGVMDQHDLASSQQSLADGQGAQGVLGHHPARVADHVGLALGQSQQAVDVQPCVHAGEDGDLPLRGHRQIGMGEGGGVVPGGGEQVVGGGHGALRGSGRKRSENILAYALHSSFYERNSVAAGRAAGRRTSAVAGWRPWHPRTSLATRPAAAPRSSAPTPTTSAWTSPRTSGPSSPRRPCPSPPARRGPPSWTSSRSPWRRSSSTASCWPIPPLASTAPGCDCPSSPKARTRCASSPPVGT